MEFQVGIDNLFLSQRQTKSLNFLKNNSCFEGLFDTLSFCFPFFLAYLHLLPPDFPSNYSLLSQTYCH